MAESLVSTMIRVLMSLGASFILVWNRSKNVRILVPPSPPFDALRLLMAGQVSETSCKWQITLIGYRASTERSVEGAQSLRALRAERSEPMP